MTIRFKSFMAVAVALGVFLCLSLAVLVYPAPVIRGAKVAVPQRIDREPRAAAGPDTSFALLAESQDPSLQLQLEGVVRRLGLWRAVENGELALLLAIVTDPDRPRLAQLNGHRMMYAASLPKIAILFGAAVSLEQGRLQLTGPLYEDIVNMIRVSCNDCATRVLERVGREELIELLQAPEYAFYDPQGEGGLWVGKDYGPAQAYRRDPLFNLSHGATAFQVARFYYRLQTGSLVAPEYARLMLEALSRPGIEHKFVKGLKGIAGVEILRKSGTWKDFHADSALVHYGDQAYIIVGLAHNRDGEQWLSRLASPMHDLVQRQERNARRLAKLSVTGS